MEETWKANRPNNETVGSLWNRAMGLWIKRYVWNQAIEIETELWPDEVLTQTHGIEEILGRIRKENQFDFRIIDIDVLFYGSEIVNQPDLQIPHPRIQDRKFVLVPLCEIAPELVHPVFKKQLANCSANVPISWR